MYLLLQKSAIDKIEADIKTPTGKRSVSTEIKYYYILHRLNHHRIFRKESYEKGVAFNSDVLCDKFSGNSIVKKVMRYLIQNNFVVRVRSHIQGHSSALYQLHKNVLNEPLYQIEFDSNDSALIRGLEAHVCDIKYFHRQLSILEEKVSLNEPGITYLKNKYGSLPISYGQLAVYPKDIGLLEIYYKRFYAYRPDLKSRVYTNLTSLSREHRQYISFDGQPMLMTDISNSQILLTVPLLHKYWAKKSGRGLFTLPQDVKDFQQLAETGKFYEHIAKALGTIFQNDDERARFKKKVFAEIWFSKNSKRGTAIKKTFKAEFPTVFSIVWALKEAAHEELNDKGLKTNAHKKFAISLQRFEASIMIDKVWMKMAKMKKTVLTLHDAIICTNIDDLEFAEELIDAEMLKYRLTPKFKRDEIILPVKAAI